MKVSFEPKKEYISSISNWLEIEFDKYKFGLYHNFEFEDKTSDNFLCYLNENDEAIGFIIYRDKGKFASIELASVKESERKKGICKLMLDSLLEKLLEVGVVVIDLYCSPSSSEKVWKKLGFKEFKERDNHRFLNWENFRHPYLYKVLVPTKKTTTEISESYIELWTLEDYKVNSNPDINPTYRWDVSNMDLPIIYPVDDDWKIRFIKKGISISNGRVKWFNGRLSNYGNFMIITEI